MHFQHFSQSSTSTTKSNLNNNNPLNRNQSTQTQKPATRASCTSTFRSIQIKMRSARPKYIRRCPLKKKFISCKNGPDQAISIVSFIVSALTLHSLAVMLIVARQRTVTLICKAHIDCDIFCVALNASILLSVHSSFVSVPAPHSSTSFRWRNPPNFLHFRTGRKLLVPYLR